MCLLNLTYLSLFSINIGDRKVWCGRHTIESIAIKLVPAQESILLPSAINFNEDFKVFKPPHIMLMYVSLTEKVILISKEVLKITNCVILMPISNAKKQIQGGVEPALIMHQLTCNGVLEGIR